ncbi:S8 family peptidase [Priestia endophytica]|uniref:S8 family peptidase n=1 Tax=Priestia endophytica TaxID=135735 RepID=UPI002280C314|nr:S8 family peptidase [Priestia endophytica]MCY8231626.1 S8 family peptidase [Priestia endophytica]
MNNVRLVPFRLGEILEQSEDQTPYGIKMINAPSLWQEEKGKDVVIAVLDTGCDISHPDLADRIIGGRNFTGGDPEDYTDSHYHGTHVAGTIAASLNEQGVVGVAPECKLLILKVLDENGSGSYQGIIDAIDYAREWRGPNQEQVRIISMSLGGPDDAPGLHDSIKKAVSADIAVVCAAGNEGDGSDRTDETAYPGYYKEVIQVGAVDEKKQLAEFSNTNDEIDLVAPGVEVMSTYPGNKFAKLSGTSMATPHVSGAIAIIINKEEKEFGRRLTEPEIYAQLTQNTVSIDLSKKAQGNGLLYLYGNNR